jgi:hypothetical protein
MNKEIKIEAVPEVVADTRQVCEIRFDCMVTMHDVAYRRHKGVWGQDSYSKTPQWFKANHILTLEAVKYADPYDLGMNIKEMFHQLEQTIEKYEQPR